MPKLAIFGDSRPGIRPPAARALAILSVFSAFAFGGAGSARADESEHGSIALLARGETPRPAPPGATTVCMFFNDVRQNPGTGFSHAHQPGIVYAVKAPVDVTIWRDGLTPTDPGAKSVKHSVAVGRGLFIPDHWFHQHSNPGAAGNEWYFISIIDSSHCHPAPASFLFASPDFPAPPTGDYIESLHRLTLRAGDQVEPRAGAGPTAYLVLTGTVTMRSGNGASTQIQTGHGFFQASGADMEISNTGDSVATLLAYEIAPREARDDGETGIGAR